METVELGSYEKCQDLRALLKRKHRFILLRSPGNKVGLSPLLADLPPGQGLLGKVTGRLPAFWLDAGASGGRARPLANSSSSSLLS